MAIVFNPKVTNAGKSAALAADDDGLELEITAVSFGTGTPYDPDGTETELVNEEVFLTIASGSRITPNQIRLTTVWESDTGTYPITEVGIWAGATLFAVWSSTEHGVLAYKTPGVPFVFFQDATFDDLPAESMTIVVDPDMSAMLALIGGHEADVEAHPQYLKRADVPQDGGALIWGGTATGTADALVLTLPVEAEVTAYAAGQRFVFVAAANNTGAVTVNVEGLGVKNVTKNGTTPLVGDDITAGAIYELMYDGTRFQIAGGVGGGNVTFTPSTFTYSGSTTVSVAYTPGFVLVIHDGAMQHPGDYTATNGTSITVPTFTSGELLVIALSTFSVANHYTKAEVDAMLVRPSIKLGSHASDTSSVVTDFYSTVSGETLSNGAVAQTASSNTIKKTFGEVADADVTVGTWGVDASLGLIATPSNGIYEVDASAYLEQLEASVVYTELILVVELCSSASHPVTSAGTEKGKDVFVKQTDTSNARVVFNPRVNTLVKITDNATERIRIRYYLNNISTGDATDVIVAKKFGTTATIKKA
jgi:hypothetical protein